MISYLSNQDLPNSDWIILQAGSKIKEADPVSMFTANLLRKMF